MAEGDTRVRVQNASSVRALSIDFFNEASKKASRASKNHCGLLRPSQQVHYRWGVISAPPARFGPVVTPHLAEDPEAQTLTSL